MAIEDLMSSNLLSLSGKQAVYKWLKDRLGRKLSFEDVLHYQKIIVALTQTSATMQRLDALY